VIWSIVQQVGGQGVSLLVYLVLANLLTPEDFGLVGLATVWTALLAAFAESGFGAALVQRRTIDATHASTTFAINLGVGAVLSLGGVLLSWPAARFTGDPRLQPVVAALSAGFLIRSLGLTHVALAQRDLRFRVLAIRDLSANTVGGALGIALALRGAGVWSLVAMSLASATVGSALLWYITPWRPARSELSRSAMGDLWRFSANILGFNLFKALAQNVDRLVIGRLLGTTPVGYYTLAVRLVLQPIGVVVGALGVYLFARVARVQGDRPRAQLEYRRVFRLAVAATAPVAAGAVTVGPPLVGWLLGPAWSPVAPVLAWLGIVALCRALFSPAGQVLKALGRPDWMLGWSVAITGLTIAAVYAGAPWGLPGVAAGVGIAHVVGVPVILTIVHRLGGLSASEHAIAGAGALAAGTALAALLLPFSWLLGHAPALLAVVTVTATIAYAAAVIRLQPDLASAIRGRLVRLPIAVPTSDEAPFEQDVHDDGRF